MTTGKRIQLARKKAGISQRELGRRLGVSGSMIGQYETDQRQPKIQMLRRIAAALGTDAFILLGEEKSGEGNREPVRLDIHIHVHFEELEALIKKLKGDTDNG